MYCMKYKFVGIVEHEKKNLFFLLCVRFYAIRNEHTLNESQNQHEKKCLKLNQRKYEIAIKDDTVEHKT